MKYFFYMVGFLILFTLAIVANNKKLEEERKVIVYQPSISKDQKSKIVKIRYYPVGTTKPYEVNGRVYYPKYDPNFEQTGLASWYGPGFHGKQAASGLIFNTNELTAAHKTLPMFSRVWVTNVKNGKKVLVTITDRGPFVSGRIIDLSSAAMNKIASTNQGVVSVQIVVDHKETEQYLKLRGLKLPETLLEVS